LQWSELYYRGYYELQISQESVKASYFGMPTIVNRNPDEISLYVFLWSFYALILRYQGASKTILGLFFIHLMNN